MFKKHIILTKQIKMPEDKNKNPAQEKGNIFVGGIVAGFITASLVTIATTFYNEANLSEIKTFQRENSKPAVMRLYRRGADSILVQDTNEPGKFIPLEQYLQSIPSQADKNIERAGIEKTVGWYD